MKQYEYIVIGGGAMGTAAAYHLARDGRQALLLEQFELGHQRGSTHGESRIIRLSYELPEYVRLMRRAYTLWAALEQDAGERLLTKTGGLDMGAPESAMLRGCIESLTLEGVEHEILDAGEIRRRFPQFRPDDGWMGLYQEDAGILPPTHCLLTLARMARHYGATIVDRTPVRNIGVRDGEIEVITDEETLRCRRLIVTAGPWAGALLRQIGLALPLTVEMQQVVFFAPADPAPFSVGRFPVFINYADPSVYGFPIYGGEGVKVAEHHGGPIINLDEYDQQVRQEGVERVREWLRRHLPGALGPLLRAHTCLYTNTPDQHFIVDRHPAHPAIAIGAGFSGHGFKFAILIGRMLADLAQDRALPPEAALFSLARLNQPDP
ncbi:MAG: N-methyltryptophan oxidase [Herpetosiphonaceae bacterium]|nr:MAG: N-methyltryptophan oxidase [Herpetosiphonaceae bacterium]